MLSDKYTLAEIRKILTEEITCDPRLVLILVELAERVEALEKRKPTYVPPPVYGSH